MGAVLFYGKVGSLFFCVLRRRNFAVTFAHVRVRSPNARVFAERTCGLSTHPQFISPSLSQA